MEKIRFVLAGNSEEQEETQIKAPSAVEIREFQLSRLAEFQRLALQKNGAQDINNFLFKSGSIVSQDKVIDGV